MARRDRPAPAKAEEGLAGWVQRVVLQSADGRETFESRLLRERRTEAAAQGPEALAAWDEGFLRLQHRLVDLQELQLSDGSEADRAAVARLRARLGPRPGGSVDQHEVEAAFVVAAQAEDAGTNGEALDDGGEDQALLVE